ncbi:Beta-ketoacyl synthase [Diaporthe amygdali]|uniref:Beta-ketoacyl synthase n=1 Tax=Phomopsis amygdali TaxID=1214568 RepID=UPI0022FE3406|nr:Beta-ketoacyl synthase [Diaporthe amygdali]KAJ0123851.1 Beta-ketoacyl synthase [Diaporthe amygdali]
MSPLNKESNEPIAIIGLGCRFPGAKSQSQLWDLLCKPRDIAKKIDRFNTDRFYHPDGSHHGTTNVKEAYFLDDDVSQFDSAFFGIPPAEASAMDPQHRILMETVYESLEDSGMTIAELQGSDTAVYVGIMCMDYYILHGLDYNSIPTYNPTGIANGNASARIAYYFDWHGPCMTIDTACSSSLVAVHLAIQALRAGTSRVAVAAGSNLLISPLGFISESKLKMLSPTGRCRMWDEAADGYSRGEGVAALVLKTLSAALADGDHIECVIRETGLNQDGRTKGITMPSGAAQAALIRDTYARAGLDLHKKTHRPQYFEAHGTGTPAGDPQEAEGIDTAFYSDSDPDTAENTLLVGSIKTVIGHTEGTAGIAGIIKACLAIKYGSIPPNLHLQNLSSSIKPFYKQLELVTSLKPWPNTPVGTPRRASVNSFGFGGTNAHAILESYEHLDYTSENFVFDHEMITSERICSILPFVFSAPSQNSLQAILESYKIYLHTPKVKDLRSLAYTLACRRSSFSHKAFFTSVNQPDLIAKIEEAIASGVDKSSTYSVSAIDRRPSTLAIFTGQGAQWPKMGLNLIQASSLARRIIHELDDSLASLPEADRPNWTIMTELERGSGESRLGEAAIAQPLVAAVQILLVNLLRLAGVVLHTVVGHSSGEIAAAYASGFISQSDAIRIAYYRGFHSSKHTKAGAMLAVGTSLEDAEELCSLEDFKGKIVVAASNSATSITVSGDVEAVKHAHIIFQEEGKFSRILRVDKAYHSHHMKPAAEPFLESLKACEIAVLARDSSKHYPAWFSSVRPKGEAMSRNDALNGQYWVDNLNSRVSFSQALETAIYHGLNDAVDVVIEVGPHPSLKSPATETIERIMGTTVPYTGTLARGHDDVEAFSASLGFVWIHGGDVEFEKLQNSFHADSGRHSTITLLKDLPTFPWSHDRQLWSESRYGILGRQQRGQFHDLLGTRTPDGTDEEWRWRNVLIPKDLSWLPDHALQGQTVFPATGYIALAMEAGMQVAAAQAESQKREVVLLELTELNIRKAIAVDGNGTETLFCLTRISRADDIIAAAFSCFSTVSKDAAARLILNATGEIQIQLGKVDPSILSPRAPAPLGLVPVDPKYFYDEVDRIGYNYGPAFRGITTMKRKLGFCSGTIKVPPTKGAETQLLFHPGMLDAALQGMMCGFSSPGDRRLWALHAPSTFKSISLVPSLCGANTTEQVHFDTLITECPPGQNRLTGDVEVFQGDEMGFKSISIEGATFIPFTEANQSNDIDLFSHTVWDVEDPDGSLVLDEYRATKSEVHAAMDAERVAYYYLRTIHQSITAEERCALDIPTHLQMQVDFADHVCNQVRLGDHPYINVDWNADTCDGIQAIIQRYNRNDPDFILIKAAGENLPGVIRGQTTYLEHLTKEKRLENYYKDGLGLVQLDRQIGEMVKQISHRYPQMNILEIGAGTGSATEQILSRLSTAFMLYTFTDISGGYLEKAQDDFSAFKDRMIFKTLDISSDPVEQGFLAGSYDLVVAANVLHATSDIRSATRNVRKLLRPGGYLVLMEVTDTNPIRHSLIFGGLPGWWREHANQTQFKCVSLDQWDEVLLKSGFSGIDTSTPVLDPVVMPGSIIVSRATDKDVAALMDPLNLGIMTVRDKLDKASNLSRTVVIIGGNRTNVTEHLVSHLVQILQPYHCESHLQRGIIHARSWEELDLKTISGKEPYSIISLSDLDLPFWNGITHGRFEKLKAVLLGAGCLLWATWGSDGDNPDGAMTQGFFRCLHHELPEIPLQIIDFEKFPDDTAAIDCRSQSEFLAGRLLRLEHTASQYKSRAMRYMTADEDGHGEGSLLWTLEPEIRVRQGRSLIPRLYPDMERNLRYNAIKRDILQEVDLDKAIVTVHWDSHKNKYATREEVEQSTVPHISGHRRVRVTSSLLASVHFGAVGRLFCSLAIDLDTAEQVLVASTKRSSAMSVPEDCTVIVEMGRGIDAQYLSFLSGYLLSRYVVSLVSPGAILVAYDVDPGLGSLLSRQLTDKRCKVLFIESSVSTTSKNVLVQSRRNRITVHPRIMDRQLRNLLPIDAAIYIDFSRIPSSGSRQNLSDSSSLGNRIASLLPDLCSKHNASLVIARESLVEPSMVAEHLDTIKQILHDANEFASAQLNGVPDGMPLRMVSVSDLVLKDNHDGDEQQQDLKSIIHWPAKVPVRVQPVDHRKDLFVGDKTYWLIGLAGNMGRSLCEFMAQHGARHVVLTSRNPKVDEQWIESLRRQWGLTVAVLKGDVSSRDDIRRVHREIIATMPPTAGVANGTLVLRDKGLVNMDLDTFHENTRCKVEGSMYLDEIFSDNTLDWKFIAFSSIVAIVGNMGQMAYSAANTFMKALVSQRRKRGLAGSSIDVSHILGVGYVERELMAMPTQQARDHAVRLMNHSGTIVMSEPDLHQLFAEAIIAGRPSPSNNSGPEIVTGIKTVSRDELSEVIWRNQIRLSHFIRHSQTSTAPAAGSATRAETASIKERLETARDDGEFREIIQNGLINKLKSGMMSGEGNLSVTTSLVDLGVDSLVAVEVRTWFSQEIAFDVGVLKILSGVSIEDLVDDAVQSLLSHIGDRRASESESGASSDSTMQSDDSAVLGELLSPVTTYDAGQQVKSV